MPTLHIQHPITDFETWASAFNRFADARRHAGVRAACVRRPVDDPNYVVIDLDFDSTEEATAFRRFLESQVWAIQENAPALVGSPETMILEPVTAQGQHHDELDEDKLRSWIEQASSLPGEKM